MPKLDALGTALPTISMAAVGVAARHASPSSLPAVSGDRTGRASSSLSRSRRIVAALLHLPVETIGTKFGGIARALPTPRPAGSSGRRTSSRCCARAFSFTLLGAIEACSRRWSRTA